MEFMGFNGVLMEFMGIYGDLSGISMGFPWEFMGIYGINGELMVS